MQEDLQELVNISRFYGQDKRYVIAGGGNTSMKTTDRIWIKASGSALSDITEDGFAKLDRGKLEKILKGEYAEDPFQREREIKDDLAEANFTTDRRPSVETSLHDLINYRFVVHLHPTQVNGLMCSNDAMDHVSKLFGKDASKPLSNCSLIILALLSNSMIALKPSSAAFLSRLMTRLISIPCL